MASRSSVSDKRKEASAFKIKFIVFYCDLYFFKFIRLDRQYETYMRRQRDKMRPKNEKNATKKILNLFSYFFGIIFILFTFRL